MLRRYAMATGPMGPRDQNSFASYSRCMQPLRVATASPSCTKPRDAIVDFIHCSEMGF